MAKIKANGRVKIGALFDGTADLDLSTVNLVKNSLSNFKKLFLKSQLLILAKKSKYQGTTLVNISEYHFDKKIYEETIKVNTALVKSWKII
jgi:hypothetical protein